MVEDSSEFEQRLAAFTAAQDARIAFAVDGQGVSVIANSSGYRSLSEFFALLADPGIDWSGGDHFHLDDLADESMLAGNRIMLDFSGIGALEDGYAADVSFFGIDEDSWPSPGEPADTPGTWTEQEKDLLPFGITWSGMTREHVIERFGEPVSARKLAEHFDVVEYEYTTPHGRSVFVEFGDGGKVVGIRIS